MFYRTSNNKSFAFFLSLSLSRARLFEHFIGIFKSTLSSYKMTATTTTTTLPKNRTRIFAGNTLEAVRNQKNVIPPLSHQYRQGDSANLPAEQDRLARNGSQPYYSHPTAMGTRNGFRPSAIRRPKSRISATMTPGDNSYRDSRENSSKDLFVTTLSSARLKSEINQLNSQLKIYGDLNRILRLQNERVRKFKWKYISKGKREKRHLDKVSSKNVPSLL